VDLVIEFQMDQHVAAVMADKIDAAGIHLIAVDIPLPRATFFRLNNYRVGFEAGECLARYAKRSWGGNVRWVLGLDIDEAGPFVRTRVTGAFEAIRARLPRIPGEFLVRVGARGLRERSCQLVLDVLRRHPEDRGILIAAATDTAALGAVQAVRETKREKYVVILGQGCIPEALDEISIPAGPLIGSVSHEAQSSVPG
jgi:ribose transport system substrate-binding protein